MKKAFSAVAIAALVTIVPTLPTQAAGTTPTPTPTPIAHTGTPPPTIYHVVTRPMCAELHKHIAPAVGMMLENDRTMKDSPKLFSDYNKDKLYGVDNSISNSAGPNGGSLMVASSGTMNAAQNMTILKMENMVSPIANNIIAMERMLDSPSLTQSTGNPDDDKMLAAIRTRLLKAIANQRATLDIINGFVQTQQMGDLQHQGDEYLAATAQTDVTGKSETQTGPSPNPLLQNPNQAGLPQNPYDYNPAAIPGLTLGANPETRLLQAVNWTLDQTRSDEDAAGNAIMTAAQVCGAGAPPPAPAPKASP